MSVIIPLSSLSAPLLKKLHTDLIVKPLSANSNPKTQMYNGMNIAPKRILIECFDSFKFNNQDVACVPFSYYYQNLQHIPSIPLHSHPKIELEFEGDLLPRQKDVRTETLEILNRTNSIILSLHTGFGKTIFTLYLLSKMRHKTIVLCHRKIIIDQWISSIQRYLPHATYSVLGEKKENLNADILIANVINVPKRERTFFASYGVVVVDEIHTICTESFSKSLLYIFPKYVIGLSATPFRTDGLDKILELFVGPEIIYRKMHKHFNVYKVDTSFAPDTKLNITGMLDWNSVLESQANDPYRNDLIVDLCRYFITRHILILVKRKDHANLLKSLLIDYGQDVDVFMGDSKTCNYNCRILIATYSKGGVGFDHPKLDMLIAAADVQESFMQYLGRIFRRDDVCPIYIDLVDQMSTLKKHSTARCAICKEIGGIIKKFDKYFPTFEQVLSKLKKS
jgi:superfamily II DNA or RNA helicase